MQYPQKLHRFVNAVVTSKFVECMCCRMVKLPGYVKNVESLKGKNKTDPGLCRSNKGDSVNTLYALYHGHTEAHRFVLTCGLKAQPKLIVRSEERRVGKE